MSKHKIHISMPRHNGEELAMSMARLFEQIDAMLDNAQPNDDAVLDNARPNDDAVEIMRKAASGYFEGSIGLVVKNTKKLLGMDPYKGTDMDMMRQLADMVERDYVSKDAMSKWLKAFQLEHGDAEMSLSDSATLHDLWTAIANDIPFGYEASKRLADWLRVVAQNRLEKGDVSGTKALEMRVEALESNCDGLRKQRDRWHSIAIGVYRRFYSRWEYSVPDDPTNLINAAIDEIERERDEWKAKAELINAAIDEIERERDEWKAKAETRDGGAGRSVFVDGERYERVRECELEYHETGWVSCRECNTSWKNDRPHVYRRCPYCGARVVTR